MSPMKKDPFPATTFWLTEIAFGFYPYLFLLVITRTYIYPCLSFLVPLYLIFYAYHFLGEVSMFSQHVFFIQPFILIIFRMTHEVFQTNYTIITL